jgi:hypothetical protein
MKRMLIPALVSLLFASCNSNSSKTETAATGDTAATATAAAANIDYAYMPGDREPNSWEMGDPKNLELVLKSLKAWENGNLDEALSPFGDSVEVAFDGFEAKLSKDSLLKVFGPQRKSYASLRIHMNDYETVTSKDKKENWVTLWYKQVWTDTKGKTDSVSVVDDLKIENGKIVVLDEKIRHYPAPKAKK